jgi:catechol 2,3-dioxygenase-like lactoylglutathione lyase family enzyme
MPKSFVTVDDVERIARSGTMLLEIAEDVYVTDAARDRAEALGLVILNAPIPRVDSFTVAKRLAMMPPMKATSHGGTTKAIEARFIMLASNLERQRKFYEDVFDWPVINHWEDGVMYDTGAGTFELIRSKESPQRYSSSRLAICVPDVSILFERLKNKVEIVFPLRNNAWGDTSFRISDPEGFEVTLFTTSS